MKREEFLILGLGIMGLDKFLKKNMTTPESLFFKDDGIIPNSKYPVLLYRNAFTQRGNSGAEWLEKTFLSNKWSYFWCNAIFTFQHYHSITH